MDQARERKRREGGENHIYTCILLSTHARSHKYIRTHTRTHAHTHTRTHAHTHTRTHALNTGARLEGAEGECEIVRVAGFLQVVTQVGVAVGNVEPKQAKALIAFLRSSVPPGLTLCLCVLLWVRVRVWLCVCVSVRV